MEFSCVVLVVVYKGLHSFILLVEGRPVHCTREVTSSVIRLLRHLTLVQKVVCLPSAAICWCFPHFFDLQHLPWVSRHHGGDRKHRLHRFTTVQTKILAADQQSWWVKAVLARALQCCANATCCGTCFTVVKRRVPNRSQADYYFWMGWLLAVRRRRRRRGCCDAHYCSYTVDAIHKTVAMWQWQAEGTAQGKQTQCLTAVCFALHASPDHCIAGFVTTPTNCKQCT